MKLVPTDLPGVVRVEPEVHQDSRGFFFEVFHAEKFAAQGVDVRFVQDNHSFSRRGALRGLHLQTDEPQGKLVRCLRGEIWDVAVDVRRGSPRFGRWTACRLAGENRLQLWIPPGFAHGFCVLSDEAEVEYKCTSVYRPQGELSVRWNDPAIGVEWPVEEPLVSIRDAAAPTLAELGERLPSYSE